MPQCEFRFECGRKGVQHNTCRPNDQPNGHIPDARWVDGARHRHQVSERTNACPLDHRDRSTSAETRGFQNPWKQKGAFSPFTNGAPAGRRRVADVPRYTTASGHQRGASESTNPRSLDRRDWSIKVADVSHHTTANGATRFGVTQYYRPEQAAPDPWFSASEKKRRGKKCFRNEKKRGADMTFPGSYKPLLMSLQEKEDWDKEIQDVTFKKKELNVVTVPYGPEDVVHFSLQDLLFRQSKVADPPVAANYSPAVHHAHPMQWRRYRTAVESEQFADAQE